MSTWAQCALQESVSPTMHLLSCFHDYCLSIIMIILTFVTGLTIFMMKNLLISESPIVTMEKVIWAALPIFILILMAVISLNLDIEIEVEIEDIIVIIILLSTLYLLKSKNSNTCVKLLNLMLRY